MSEPEREKTAAEGRRVEERDHALVQLDEKEVRARITEAFDRFMEMGFEAHLVGLKTRKGNEFKLMLSEDGADDIPIRDIQAVADELRLDVFFEKERGLVMYARW